MLEALLPAEVFVILLVFCRIGAAAISLPTVGEAFISPRIRLFLIITISVILAPVVEDKLPRMPDALLSFVLLIFTEIFIGIFIGVMMRIIFTALATAGTIIAFLTGFSNAQLFNPLLSDQGSLHAVLLSLLGMMMVFVTDLHHLLFLALADSYSIFQPGVLPMIGDMADSVTRSVAKSFEMGFSLAAPFVVIGLIYNVLLGLMARLMPQFQVFFVAMPLQITLGLAVLFIVLPALMLWFLNYYEETVANFLFIR